MNMVNKNVESFDEHHPTRQLIFEAFARLFAGENYADITVRQIIREAGIGHSTFYDHYASKEALLDDLCADTFHHISSQIPSASDGDDINQRTGELIPTVAHLLFHLREDNSELRGLLTGASAGLFLRKIEPYLRTLLSTTLARHGGLSSDLGAPEDFVLHHLVGSFNTAVKWWVAQDFAQSPEAVAGYLASMLPAQLLSSGMLHGRNRSDDC